MRVPSNNIVILLSESLSLNILIDAVTRCVQSAIGNQGRILKWRSVPLGDLPEFAETTPMNVMKNPTTRKSDIVDMMFITLLQ